MLRHHVGGGDGGESRESEREELEGKPRESGEGAGEGGGGSPSPVLTEALPGDERERDAPESDERNVPEVRCGRGAKHRGRGAEEGRSARGAVRDREAGDGPDRKRRPDETEDVEDGDRGETDETQRKPEEPVSDERLGEGERIRVWGEDIRVENAERRGDERVPDPGDTPRLELRVVSIAEVRAEAGQNARRPRRGDDQTDEKINRSRTSALHSGI